jgi:MFS transporter, DHA1 family, inner membrane transport protein
MNDPQRNPASSGWGTIIIAYLLAVLAATCIGQVVPIVGDIARFFHLARQQVGWVISIPSAILALGALLIGWLVDRMGDKPLVLFGAVLLIVGDLGAALTGSVNALLLMRVIEGIGYGFVSVGTVTMIARVTSGKRRTSALTLWSSCIPMSFAIPFAFAGLLAGTGYWRWAFNGHAAAVLALGVMGIWLPSSEIGTAVARSAGLSAVLRTPACYALGIAFAAAAFVQTGIVSTLPQMLASQQGLSIGMAHAVATIGMVCNVIGCLCMGQMLNRGLPKMVVAIGSVLVTAVAGIGTYLEGMTAAVTVVLALVFFFSSGLLVGLWALLPAVAPTPTSRGATSGLVTQLTIWGVLFGPPAAFAAQAGGGRDREMLNIIVALLLCALMLWVVIRRTGERLEAVDAAASGHTT